VRQIAALVLLAWPPSQVYLSAISQPVLGWFFNTCNSMGARRGRLACPLDTLPAEILLAILRAITDFRTLETLVTTSPRCWRLYYNNGHWRSSIDTAILLRRFGNHVLPEAIAVLDSSRMVSRGIDDINNFLGGYLASLAQDLPRVRGGLTFSDIRQILTFADIVDRLSDEFCIGTLEVGSNLPDPQALDPYEPPSQTESARIRRAFYRLELLRNITRGLDPGWEGNGGGGGGGDGLARNPFIVRYRPWEVEELLCVATFARGCYGDDGGNHRTDVCRNIFGNRALMGLETLHGWLCSFSRRDKMRILARDCGQFHMLVPHLADHEMLDNAEYKSEYDPGNKQYSVSPAEQRPGAEQQDRFVVREDHEPPNGPTVAWIQGIDDEEDEDLAMESGYAMWDHGRRLQVDEEEW
jgi:hypothetical protein